MIFFTILKEKITVQGPAFIEGEVDPQGGASYDVNIRANTGEVGNVTMTVASGVCTLGKRSSKKSMVLPGGTLQVDTERPTAQVGVLTPFSNKVNSTLTMRIVMPRDSKGSLQASSFDVVNGNVSTVTEENKSVLEGERAFLISVITSNITVQYRFSTSPSSKVIIFGVLINWMKHTGREREFVKVLARASLLTILINGMKHTGREREFVKVLPRASLLTILINGMKHR